MQCLKIYFKITNNEHRTEKTCSLTLTLTFSCPGLRGKVPGTKPTDGSVAVKQKQHSLLSPQQLHTYIQRSFFPIWFAQCFVGWEELGSRERNSSVSCKIWLNKTDVMLLYQANLKLLCINQEFWASTQMQMQSYHFGGFCWKWYCVALPRPFPIPHPTLGRPSRNMWSVRRSVPQIGIFYSSIR